MVGRLPYVGRLVVPGSIIACRERVCVCVRRPVGAFVSRVQSALVDLFVVAAAAVCVCVQRILQRAVAASLYVLWRRSRVGSGQVGSDRVRPGRAGGLVSRASGKQGRSG